MAKSPPAKAPAPDTLDGLLGAIRKDVGAESIAVLGSQPVIPVDVISSGALPLDLALGIGGLPRGRVVEIYGPESGGKTTQAVAAVVAAQRIKRADGSPSIAAFIDAEHALSEQYAADMGVDRNRLLISQPDSGEQGLRIAEKLAASGLVDIIIIDSVAALVPQAEIDGEIGDQHVGRQARLMSAALRTITATMSKRTCVVFINQLREKVGVQFGNPETTPGGKALKFYSSVRLDVRRIETLKSGTEAIGNRVRVKVVKNKLASPFKVAEYDIIFGKGISAEGAVLDMGVDYGVVTKSGAFYTYNGASLGQGKDKARLFLLEHPELAAEISAKVTAAVRSGAVAAKPAPELVGKPADGANPFA